MHYTKAFFEKMLVDIRQNIELTKQDISTCPAGKLYSEMRGEERFYFCATPSDKGRAKRKLINQEPETVRGLLRRYYLEAQQAVFEEDARLLEALIAEFTDTVPGSYVKLMPERLQKLPAEWGLLGEPNEWANAEFEQSSYKPDEKSQTTSRGVNVRSKSEALIAEKLFEFGVPFRYEQLLHIGNYNYAPDFTVLNVRTNKVYYWEHFGLVNSDKYQERRRKKLSAYEAAGIVPWDNLITTYDDTSGNLDLQFVESIIKCKLL